MKSTFVYLLLLSLLFSCARTPLTEKRDALKVSPKEINLKDVDFLSFKNAFKKYIKDFENLNVKNKTLNFGPYEISSIDYFNELKKLETFLDSEESFYQELKTRFLLLEVYGKDDWSEVFVTGYYQPKILGSLKKTEVFSEPLLSRPKDLISISTNKYKETFKMDFPFNQMKGRLVDQNLIPYFDRCEISYEKNKALENLALVYVDPIEAFVLQIQGSGIIDLGDGSILRMGYADQNGHPYEAVGKYLADVIPIKEMTMKKIMDHLRTLSPKDLKNILCKNPSYVFFKKLDGEAITQSGMNVISGRTIATDLAFFPKGAMAFLDFKEENSPLKSRLVFDQDTGGAIKGGGRVDLYIGEGVEAFEIASGLKEKASLFYFFPRVKFTN